MPVPVSGCEEGKNKGYTLAGDGNNSPPLALEDSHMGNSPGIILVTGINCVVCLNYVAPIFSQRSLRNGLRGSRWGPNLGQSCQFSCFSWFFFDVKFDASFHYL